MKRRCEVASTIPSSSMADIAFLLIIFFMVSTSFSKDKVQVNLPDSMYRNELPKDAIIISITEEGELHYEGKPTTMEDILNLASYEVRIDKYREFILKIDRNVEYREVDTLMEVLRLAHVINIALPTNQETVGG